MTIDPLVREKEVAWGSTATYLTLDIEEWYHANYQGVDYTRFYDSPTTLEEMVDRLIERCHEWKVQATCFVLASVAAKKPAIVRKLHAAGHEIASHGYSHRVVHAMIPEEFRAEMALSNDILEQITGEKVLGFRAPSFSVTKQCMAWYYEALEAVGLRYSSSVFPGQTFLYGVPGSPRYPHFPRIDGRNTSILEFPLPVVHLPGTEMGLYIRLFPAWFIRRFIRRENARGIPTVLYVHPREIDPDQPRLDLPLLTRLIHYWGIRGCEAKLGRVLGGLPGRFIPMRDSLLLADPKHNRDPHSDSGLGLRTGIVDRQL
jgi:polysaccharide deacetylase family protein (PEP-CTERM system associated)